ncbi:MAG: hypothetical protein ACYDHM_14200 [Acidiferrobacterales bacterium]
MPDRLSGITPQQYERTAQHRASQKIMHDLCHTGSRLWFAPSLSSGTKPPQSEKYSHLTAECTEPTGIGPDSELKIGNSVAPENVWRTRMARASDHRLAPES